MKFLNTKEEIEIPSNVDIKVKSRIITIKGPHGSVKKNFKHIPVDMRVETRKDGKKFLIIEMWFGGYKQKACVSTVCGIVKNSILGVTRIHKYRMKSVYAHFPVIMTAINNGHTIELANFLGEKHVKRIDLHEGVTATKKEEVKDQIELQGVDLENLSLSCALINQICKIRDKDNRKFLDGIFVSERGFADEMK